MFTIVGEKTKFNQWEQNQQVTESSLVAGDKVIFLNSSGMTHPMQAYTNGSEVVVDVPNKILTIAAPVVVYINGRYDTRTSIPVDAQTKPTDYVFVDNDDWPVNNTEEAKPKVIDLDELGYSNYILTLFTQGGGETGITGSAIFDELNGIRAGKPIIAKCSFAPLNSEFRTSNNSIAIHTVNGTPMSFSFEVIVQYNGLYRVNVRFARNGDDVILFVKATEA